MDDSAKFKVRTVALILALALVHAIILLLYAHYHMHGAPLPGDEEHKITQAANFFYAPWGTKISILDLAPYPPLVNFIAYPLFSLFGVVKTSAVAVNVTLLPIFFLSIFYLSTKLGLARQYGLFVAILTMFLPGVFALSRVYYQDFANIVMVTASMALLVSTEGFSKRKQTILFGVVAALGMLTRGNNPIFWLAPAAWVFAGSILFGHFWGREGAIPGGNKKNTLINVILGMAIGLSVASLWYLHNFPEAIKFGLFRVTENANMANVAWNEKKSLLFYLYSLIDYQISPILFFPVIAVGVFGVFKNPKKAMPLVLWIVIPYLFFIFPKWKLARYIAPFLPAFTLLFFLGIASIKPKILRWAVVSLTLVAGLFQFALFSLPENKLPANKFIGNGRLASTLLGFSMEHTFYQDDDPKPILNWNLHIKEVSRVLESIQQRNPGTKLDIYCFGQVSQIPGSPGIVIFPYSIGYIIAQNHLYASFTWGGIEENGELFIEEATVGLVEQKHPSQCNVIMSYDRKPLETLGLTSSYTLLGEFSVQGQQGLLGIWEKNKE